MTGWGSSSWGLGVWGGDGIFGITEASGVNPIVLSRSPGVAQLSVEENVTISVEFFDVNFDLDPTTIEIYVNNALAYSGISGFSAGYYGRVTYGAGTAKVQLVYAQGFEFGQTVRMRAIAFDALANAVDDSWYFVIKNDEICYSGLDVLPIETALQTPFLTFLEMENLRNLMFGYVIRPQTLSVTNQGNKAARAIYQLAFATELSTIQNKYNLRNEDALTVRVCEKQSALRIDAQLQRYRPKIDASLAELRLLNAFSDEYIRAFQDYADSSLYLYRVSLVANMLLFAKSIELNQ